MEKHEIKTLAENVARETARALVANSMDSDIKDFRGKRHPNGTVEFPRFVYRGYDIEIWGEANGKFIYYIVQLDSRERDGGSSFQSARAKAHDEINKLPPR